MEGVKKNLEGLDGMAPFWEWPMALFRFIWHICSNIIYGHEIDGQNIEIEQFDTNNEGRGLAVVLHGFRARRIHFYRKLKMIRENLGEKYRCVYAPVLQYEHVGDIYEANKRVFRYVQSFCEQYPTEPVVIIGISAGGRLATFIENDLRMQTNTVHVVTLASPLRGTSVVKISPSLARRVCGKECFEEFEPEGERQMMIELILREVPAHHSYYHFYSTTDWIVFPPWRCLGPGDHQDLGACPHPFVQVHPEFLRYIKALQIQEK